MDKLEKYLVSTNIEKKIQARNKMTSAKFISVAKANVEKGIDDLKLVCDVSFKGSFTIGVLESNWAIELLNEFDNSRQRILVEYFRNRDRSTTISSTQSLVERVAIIEKMLLAKVLVKA
jgi:hypothetical protein